MAVTTTRNASAFVRVLKDIHSGNPGTALPCPEEANCLGKEWLEGRKTDSLIHRLIGPLIHWLISPAAVWPSQ
jgi:hypothetical protein